MSFHHINSYATLIQSESNFLEVHNVRIQPKSIVFENPFEGKHFQAKITLQNVGVDAVKILILCSTSSHVKIKRMHAPQTLAPGLRIVKNIYYRASMTSLINSCSIPIYIDDKEVYYKVEIAAKKNCLIVEPHFINFGLIDAGPSVVKRRLSLINSGTQPMRYSIDLGPNKHNISVEPMKGVVMAGAMVELRVEVSSFVEGDFVTEFWIINEKPQCVVVNFKARLGKFYAIHPLATKDFTFLHFPLTYYGTESRLIMQLKNASQSSSVFCITAEHDNKTFLLRDIKETEPVFNFFTIHPIEGRFLPQDKNLITFTFTPSVEYLKSHKHADNFFLIIVKINKLYCKDLNPEDYGDDMVFEYNEKSNISSPSANSIISASFDADKYASPMFEMADDLLSDEDANNRDFVNPEYFFEGNIRLFLYARAEMPSVSIVPDEIIVNNLCVKKCEMRVLRIKNHSELLPIIFRSNKVTFIEVNPKMGYLKPGESLELSVAITPGSFTIIKRMLCFDLLYYDRPRMDKSLKMVGQVKVRLAINEEIMYEQKTNCFDCSKNIKEAHNGCLQYMDKNLFVPPDEKYKLDDKFQILKDQNHEYYKKFIRNYAKTHKPKKTNEMKLKSSYKYDIMPDKCVELPDIQSSNYICADFIPLTPLQLFNIIINPRNVRIRNIAPKSSFEHSFTIFNRNNVALRIYLKPIKKQAFAFPHGNRFKVLPFTDKTLTVVCFTGPVGLQTQMLEIIVNQAHIFETSVTMEVETVQLQLDKQEITFLANQPNTQAIQFYNPLNVDIKFEWESIGDFIVEPMDGTVAPGKALTCNISYEFGVCLQNNYELIVMMGSGRHVKVFVILEMCRIELKVEEVVSLGPIALGVEINKSTYIKNIYTEKLMYKIKSSHLPPELELTPVNDYILPKCGALITIKYTPTKLGKHNYTAPIYVGNTLSGMLIIHVEVFLPKYDIVPDVIRFRKISASAFDVREFKIINAGSVPLKLQYDVNRYPELYLSEKNHSKFFDQDTAIIIKPLGSASFWLHYYPYYPMHISFYLPLIINNTSGKNLNLNKKNLPKIMIASSSHKLGIKTWNYKFTYFPHYDYANVTVHEFRIQNPHRHTLKFCIRLDSLGLPFSFAHIFGGERQEFKSSMVITLALNEIAIFVVHFNPTVPGIYHMKLPVYVKDDTFEDVHNYMQFDGEYLKAKIDVEPSPIYFSVLPLSFRIMKSMKVTLTNHNPDCQLTIKQNNPNVSINFNPDYEMAMVTSVVVEIEIYSESPIVIKSAIKISCSCGQSATVHCIGAIQNCYLSNHACVEYFAFSENKSDKFNYNYESKSSINTMNTFVDEEEEAPNLFETEFPRFPNDDESQVAYMTKVLNVVESWLYRQAFFRADYFKIPDTLSIVKELNMSQPSFRDASNVSSNGTVRVLPIVHFLVNMCGIRVKHILPAW